MSQVPLGETARFINGAAFKPSDWKAEGLPIVRIQNLTGTGETFNYTTRQVKPELIVEPGDLLVSWSATLDVYRWNGPRGLLNQHIFKVLPKEGIDADYLYFALKGVIRELESKTHGSTMKHVVRGDFEGTLIPLPSLIEQRRIVDLLSRAENILRLRREAQAKAQAIIPALFLDMFGDPATNPKGWNTTRLGEVVEFRSGGTPSKARQDFWTGDLPWVSPKDMKTTVINDAADHVSGVVLTETNLKLIPSGTVLIVVRGMILAHTVPVALAAVPLTINQDMKALLPHEGLGAPYLLWALKVLHQRLLGMVSTAAHGTKKLDTEHLESLSLPLPLVGMQSDFAGQVNALASVVARQAEALRKAEAIFQALLSRAFTSSQYLQFDRDRCLVNDATGG